MISPVDRRPISRSLCAVRGWEDRLRLGVDDSCPPGTALPGGPVDRHFEFTEGATSKFRVDSQEGKEMTTRSGKIGTNGPSPIKSSDSPEEAAKIFAKKVK